MKPLPFTEGLTNMPVLFTELSCWTWLTTGCMLVSASSMITIWFKWHCRHTWLSNINAPVGYQEVADQIHELMLISSPLSVCKLGQVKHLRTQPLLPYCSQPSSFYFLHWGEYFNNPGNTPFWYPTCALIFEDHGWKPLTRRQISFYGRFSFLLPIFHVNKQNDLCSKICPL